jgi:hypothetical protein
MTFIVKKVVHLIDAFEFNATHCLDI